MAQSSSAQRDPSMEEILASIRKIIEEGEETAPRVPQRDSFESAAIGPAANDVARPALASRAEFAVGPAIVENLEPEFEEAVLDADTIASLEAATAEIAPSITDEDLTIGDFDFEIDEAEVRSVAPAPAPRSSIISESTGRQVTASFGELVEALSVNRQRSLDQIAEEVLRPMLQDWLDNNLPTLVEKLVREEIERVARGG